MFGRLAHLIYRRRWYVVGAWLLILVVAMAGASKVSSVLGPGDFVQKGSDSARASALLDSRFHQNDQKVTLVVMHSRDTTIHDLSFRQAVAATEATIRADRGLRVSYVDNPIRSGNRQLISRDGHAAAILVSSNLSEAHLEAQIDHLRSVVHRGDFTTYVAGTAAANHDYAVQSEKDLAKGDSITVPILIIILLLVFGTLVATSLPLVLAAFSITLSLALVYVFGHFIDTSIYVTNVVTVLGIGVGIDYSLFIVYRFREELRGGGLDVERAVVRTMESSGRAVFFSGITVAIGLSSLILTNVSFMQSMGLGGMLVPLTSLVVAMTLLPALLGILGHKVNRLRVVPRRFLRTGEGKMWHRMAKAIMRRPIIAGGLVLALLLGLTYPVTHLSFAFGGLKNSPHSLESVAGAIYVRDHFPGSATPIQVVVQHHSGGNLLQPKEIAGIRALETAIRQDPLTARVDGPAEFLSATGVQSQAYGRYLTADGQTAIISVVGKDETGSKGAEDLVRHLRTLASQTSLRADSVYVGGAQASFTDFNDALYAHFPLVVTLVLILTYIFLFYAFRSAFLPLKAVVLNLLSVGAAYGMLQLVFQQGIGSSILGFSPESGVAGWVPIFLFAFLFGLSMDYEVFLLSRVREGWLATRDNTESVAIGLEKTGRLISSAAAIMVVAFSGFLVGTELQLKEFGFALLASIALDASLIRLVLVPAIMRLMGDWNWWVPQFLSGFAARSSAFAEGDVEPETVEIEQMAA